MTSTTTDRRFGVSGNLPFKAPVRCATTANITLSGLQTVDGVALAADDRVLVMNQTTASQNGIYTASTGAWSRAIDFNGSRDVVKGTAVYVTDGSTNAGAYYYVSSSNPITIGTSSITFAISVAAGNLATQLANTSNVVLGDALVGELLTDTAAIATTLHEQNERRILEVFDFMTSAQIADVCSAAPVLDHTAAIQAAINAAQVLAKGERRLRINSTLEGYFRITSALTVTTNFLTVEWDSNSAIIKKFFNGDMFRINGGEVEFHRCALDGNGATYTGGGIRLLNNAANSFRLINPRIKETASAPLLIEADAGSLMKVVGGLLQPYNAAAAGPTHAVAMTAADTGPANRKIIGVSTGGAPICDATGAETIQVIGCDGSHVTTTGTSKKISLIGNRLQTAGANMALSGTDHCVVGNTIASRIELTPGATNCVVKENVQVGGDVIDSSGNTSNKVVFFGSSYTPTWTAETTGPTLGNGTLTGRFDRHDKDVKATGFLEIGSTTTTGTGAYSFAIPLQAAASRDFVGSVWLRDSGTNFRVGVVLVTASALTAQMYFEAAATAMGPTVPITLATGDQLRWEINYVAA